MNKNSFPTYEEWLIENKPPVKSKLTAEQQEFFNNIDSEQKAYYLGLFLANGYINIRFSNIEITASEKDKEHLQRFADIFNKELTLHEKHNKVYDKTYAIYRVTISSLYIVQQLTKVKGLDSNKTVSLSEKLFEHIPEYLWHHLTRGFFDGKGTIADSNSPSNSFTITGTESFLKFIQKQLVDNCGINEPSLTKTKSGYQLNSGGTNQLIKIRDYLYKDATIYLNRKRDKFFGYEAKEFSSKYHGVTYRKDNGKWRAKTTINGKRINIGTFGTEIEAAKAYDKVMRESGCANYLLNFVEE